MKARFGTALFVVLSMSSWAAHAGVTIGNAFTYQGQLKGGGVPVDGTADFQFSLWAHVNDIDPADQVGSTLEVSNVAVENGLFTVSLDFAVPNAFNGLDRWLQVAVRTPHDPADLAPFTTLTTRQPISPTPYAVKAFSTVGVDGHSLDAADGAPLDAVFVDNSGNVSIDFRLIFSPGATPLMTAGQDNNVARPKRMWIAHSETFQSFGIQYRDLFSDSLSGDAIEFVAGNAAIPPFRFDLGARAFTTLNAAGDVTLSLLGQAGRVIFGPGAVPLMTAGHDNNPARPKRMWIAHSELHPEWGIQYRDIPSDGWTGDTIEFVAGDNTLPRFRFDLPARNLELLDSNNRVTTRLNGQAGEGGGGMTLFNSLGNLTIEVDADEADSGVMRLYSSTAQTRVYIAASEGAEGAEVHLRNAAGLTTIQLDADVSGDGRIVTQELQVTGGSDLSEQFDINPSRDREGAGSDQYRDRYGAVLDESQPQPGMVVSIDPRNAGKLIVSGGEYDRTVAGVISGAGGVKPGMLMGQAGTQADGKYPVALTGRVYCWCDATAGAIAPGDLLTTSNRPGHAMKVTDHGRAQGAIIGKAMTSLEEGQGLVLVLVSLQ